MLFRSPGLMEYCGFSRTGETLQTRIPQIVSTLPVSLKGASEPPRLGEHNREILEGLGYSGEEIANMISTGACGSLQKK